MMSPTTVCPGHEFVVCDLRLRYSSGTLWPPTLSPRRIHWWRKIINVDQFTTLSLYCTHKLTQIPNALTFFFMVLMVSRARVYRLTFELSPLTFPSAMTLSYMASLSAITAVTFATSVS